MNKDIGQPTPSKQKQTESGGWKFCPVTIAIAAPEEFQDTFSGIINESLAEQGGFLPNNTDWPMADEELDSLLMVECYNVKCSLLPYYKELERFGIVGGATPFLCKENTEVVFYTLKSIVGFIKDNTERPMAVQNLITSIVKEFDKMPVWGLFFQILTLQGILVWLENVDISEGDDGYKEGMELCKWVWSGLMEKEVFFSYQQYGDGDLVILRPFCRYLLSTDTGKLVQEFLFGDDEQPDPDQQPNDGQPTIKIIPLTAQQDIMTDRAKKYFEKAIKAGYMEKAGNGYKWILPIKRGAKAALSYFLMKVYSPDPTNSRPIPFKALEELFGVTRLDSTLRAALDVTTPQGWRCMIDALFND